MDINDKQKHPIDIKLELEANLKEIEAEGKKLLNNQNKMGMVPLHVKFDLWRIRRQIRMMRKRMDKLW